MIFNLNIMIWIHGFNDKQTITYPDTLSDPFSANGFFQECYQSVSICIVH